MWVLDFSSPRINSNQDTSLFFYLEKGPGVGVSAVFSGFVQLGGDGGKWC